MESQNQNMKDNQEEKQRNQESEKASISSSNSSSAAASTPSSTSSSPSHEFSFTISFQQTKSPQDNKTKQTPPSSFIDLSPADDIFFHGHLLPLHFLSHLPVSPRTSTNSMDSLTLPIKDLLQDHKLQNSNNQRVVEENTYSSKGKNKNKSFSLFGLPKWRKGYEVKEKENREKQRKVKFDVTQVVKRYIRMIRPLLSIKRRNNMEFHRGSYSNFSGNLNLRGKEEIGEQLYSAPASIRTSPTNSGLLVATPTGVSSTSRDSSMEELQSAIQAAIAHCKKSISMEDKNISHND